MLRHLKTAAAAALAVALPALAMTDDQLEAHLKQRFEGDRTGVCVHAALVERDQVARARYCARADRHPDADAAFEIGSVTKTMTAFLVADLMAQRGWSLDDPVAKHLPPGTRVPTHGGREIRLRHLLTHTSGLPPLPPGMNPVDPRDPYAGLTEAALLKALGETHLDSPPGTQPAYSNFGMMVVSLAVSRAYGGDLEGALRSRLFEPLGMRGASIRPREGVAWAQGHGATGRAVPAWTIVPSLAGVGMVRARLEDMVNYAQAQLGVVPTPLAGRLLQTQQPVAAGMGMNWALPTLEGRQLVLHEGGTGGFSAIVALDRAAQRGVVMLADTALHDLGGLGDAALPLLVSMPVGTPRRAVPVAAHWFESLPGEYELPALNLRLRIRAEGGRLLLQATGQPEEVLGLDSRGDFHPASGAWLLTPAPGEGQGQPVRRLVLRQGGAVLEVVRLGADTRPTATNPAWQPLAGDYDLTPLFSLRVFEQDGQLMVQGTGQPAVAVEHSGPHRVEARRVGAVIDFLRDESGQVTGLRLQQGGVTLEGRRRR